MTETQFEPDRRGTTRLSFRERRDSLVDVGLQVFLSQGSTSLETVARHAGVSRNLPFHYFGSRASFWGAVYQRAVERLLAQSEPDSALERDDGLKQWLTKLLLELREHPIAYATLARAFPEGDASLQRPTLRSVVAGRAMALARIDASHAESAQAWAAYIADRALQAALHNRDCDLERVEREAEHCAAALEALIDITDLSP